MTAFTSLNSASTPALSTSKIQSQALMQGEILVSTKSHTAWGGAVTAQMYIPLSRQNCWQQLIDYPRWVQYFPNLTRSEVLQHPSSGSSPSKRIYQVGSKNFILFTAQVEIYLKVSEIAQRQIQFRLEKGSFLDFSADLELQDAQNGTLLTYSVQATPNFPIPGTFIQQALQLELPTNMQQMRRVLCG